MKRAVFTIVLMLAILISHAQNTAATTTLTATPAPSLLGHTLGDSFQEFSTRAIPAENIKECKQSDTWAGKHNRTASIISSLLTGTAQNPDGDYTVPPPATSDCANYLSLIKDSKATGTIDCDSGLMCDSFAGQAAFRDNQLEALAFIAPQNWDDVLTNAIQKFGEPDKQVQNGSIHVAGWKKVSYILIITEQVTDNLQRRVVVYLATPDRAFADGLCKSCAHR